MSIAPNIAPSIAPLEQVLLEESEWTDEIVHRFSEDYGVSVSDSHKIFVETKRWLWLCAYRKVQFEQGEVDLIQIPLASEAAVIDWMWHTFLLFTKEYSDFCHRHFGFFIHHYPTSRADQQRALERQERDPQAFRVRRMEELRPTYEYIHDVLGRETLIRWFEELPKIQILGHK